MDDDLFTALLDDILNEDDWNLDLDNPQHFMAEKGKSKDETYIAIDKTGFFSNRARVFYPYHTKMSTEQQKKLYEHLFYARQKRAEQKLRDKVLATPVEVAQHRMKNET